MGEVYRAAMPYVILGLLMLILVLLVPAAGDLASRGAHREVTGR